MSIFHVDDQALEEQRAAEAVTIRQLAHSAEITVESAEQAEAAVAALGEVSRARKNLEARRKDTKAPVLEASRRIDALFKDLDEPLAAAEANLKGGIKAWREIERKQIEAAQRAEEEARQAAIREAEEQRRRQEEAARAEREAAAREAAKAQAEARRGDHEAEQRAEAARQAEEQARMRELVAREVQPVVSAPVAPVAEQASQIKAGSASVSVRKVWQFEVTDPSRVPSAFLTVDEKKIRQAVKEGVRDIPGVRIFEDEQIASRAA